MISGAISSADAYTACATAFNLAPTAAIPAESNGLTIAGGSHAQARAFVARLPRRRQRGLHHVSGNEDASGPVFVASAIAELPTTGFVMTSSLVELTSEDASEDGSRHRARGPRRAGPRGMGEALRARRALSSDVPVAASHDGRRRARVELGRDHGRSDRARRGSMKAFAKDGTVNDPCW